MSNKWIDIGSWDNFSKIFGSINKKNKHNFVEFNSSNNFIYSPNNLTVTLGTDNLIIVNINNATLIMKRGESEKLKK